MNQRRDPPHSRLTTLLAFKQEGHRPVDDQLDRHIGAEHRPVGSEPVTEVARTYAQNSRLAPSLVGLRAVRCRAAPEAGKWATVRAVSR